MDGTVDVIDRIVQQNLGVYRAAESRLREDVSQEAQIASDYRGRLVYELLQNADDAMADQPSEDDRVAFIVEPGGLWVANSGRPLTEADVQGLCGLGAGSKAGRRGRRRASIGHKGLGFKSVLEITDEPTVYSTTHSFTLGRQHARRRIDELFSQLDRDLPSDVPAMRFPVVVQAEPARWKQLRDGGYNTAFWFPFRQRRLDEDRRSVADVLTSLPLTSVLFLKHLEAVSVAVELPGHSFIQRWHVVRQRKVGDWKRVSGMGESGTYRVSVRNERGDEATFMVAHDADVDIGAHRDGLDGPAWSGVDVTEVSVAALEPGQPTMPSTWRRFHVFLPTAEPCPYPLLVNGAFSTDLSRQTIRVGPDPTDYNRHLIHNAANLLRTRLLPELRNSGVIEPLAALERDTSVVLSDGGVAECLRTSVIDALIGEPMLCTPTGEALAFDGAVLPDSSLGADAVEYRSMLPLDAGVDGRRFPSAELCAGRWSAIAADHGARVLTAVETIEVLAVLAQDASTAGVVDGSNRVQIDPVLRICERVWERSPGESRAALEHSARLLPLFPIAQRPDGSFERVCLEGDTAFYPPRSASSDLPLSGLRFMCHSVCWGALDQNQRQVTLSDRMLAWRALFDVREFSFDEVFRAAVAPALTLAPDPRAALLRSSLETVESLAALCQLAGQQLVKPDRPLRYQRLKSDRALFRLSRLPVPCRGPDGSRSWHPAYRVYFGEDWIGSASIEPMLRLLDPEDAERVQVHYLAPPDELVRHLDDRSGEEPSSTTLDEEDDDVDIDAASTGSAFQRWIAFLSWIGVNRALRPIHFHDVEEPNAGWLTTRGLSPPQGWAFADLGDQWNSYASGIQHVVQHRANAASVTPYWYEVHDLEHIAPIVRQAEREADATLAEALFSHLAANWAWLSTMTNATVAVIEHGKSPGQRTNRAAFDDELVDVGDNFWVYRLSQSGICPTSQGPRRPGRSWLPTEELDRRFGRRGRDTRALLPVIEQGRPELWPSRRALAVRLGVRDAPTSSTFVVDDARVLFSRLEELYPAEHVSSSTLREVIRPVYRQVFELLSGRSTSADSAAPVVVRLLAETESGLRYLDSRDVLFTRTPGFRERAGVDASVPTFVLEALPASFAPLERLFGSRALEQALTWAAHPVLVDFADDDRRIALVRSGLRELEAPLLARIRVERDEARDRRLVREYLDVVTPVAELSVSCHLDDLLIEQSRPASYFVQQQPAQGGSVQAFVVWPPPTVWPPDPETVNGLAMGLADLLGLNMVETFVAFIGGGAAQRERLLRVAGAEVFLGEVGVAVADASDADGSSAPVDPAPTPDPERQDPGRHLAAPAAPFGPSPSPVPLRAFDDLLVDGEPLTIHGHRSARTERQPNGAGKQAGVAPHDGAAAMPRAAPGTDLSALDALGMRIAVEFELRRLVRAGHTTAEVLNPPDESDDATIVVDVHTPDAIRAAEACSRVARRALSRLQLAGISRVHPGCDLLTIVDGEVDRLIELKSSLVDANVQQMSWNEWKSAANGNYRPRFWLYLVGNLRADLGAARPFIRAVRDPFGSLLADEHEQRNTRRAVQLRVREFSTAEELVLGIRPPLGQPNEAS